MINLHLESVDSTQNYAKNHPKKLSSNQILCISADEQTAGRGRYNRQWVSPKGNLYLTFAFQLPSSISVTCLAQIMAFSIAQLLIQEGFTPQIKWPNDILIRGKKVAGILCETTLSSEETAIFLGVGLNVNMGKEALESIDQPATSLQNETKSPWNKQNLLTKLQNQFLYDLETYIQNGFSYFHKKIDRILAWKGKEITLFDGEKRWKGICHSLSPDGRLNLLLENGSIQSFYAGDVAEK